MKQQNQKDPEVDVVLNGRCVTSTDYDLTRKLLAQNGSSASKCTRCLKWFQTMKLVHVRRHDVVPGRQRELG